MTNEQTFLARLISGGQTSLDNLLLHHYKALYMTDQEFIFIIQLKSFLDRGDCFPDMRLIAKHMQVTEEEVFQMINQLIQKRCLSLKSYQNPQGKLEDAYSILPLYQQLERYHNQAKASQQVQGTQDLMQLFQKEFNRQLSPMELQILGDWLDEDGFSLEMIQLALREAVLSQVYNLRYIDRILLSWKQKNLRTKEQISQYLAKQDPDKRGSGAQKEKINQQNNINIPLFDWTDPNAF